MKHRCKELITQTYETNANSAEKIKAFVDDILLQCQNKGLSENDVRNLLSGLNDAFVDICYINWTSTPFRCEN